MPPTASRTSARIRLGPTSDTSRWRSCRSRCSALPNGGFPISLIGVASCRQDPERCRTGRLIASIPGFGTGTSASAPSRGRPSGVASAVLPAKACKSTDVHRGDVAANQQHDLACSSASSCEVGVVIRSTAAGNECAPSRRSRPEYARPSSVSPRPKCLRVMTQNAACTMQSPRRPACATIPSASACFLKPCGKHPLHARRSPAAVPSALLRLPPQRRRNGIRKAFRPSRPALPTVPTTSGGPRTPGCATRSHARRSASNTGLVIRCRVRHADRVIGVIESLRLSRKPRPPERRRPP